MSHIDGYHCDCVVIFTYTTYAYLTANDHYYGTPPNMVDVSMLLHHLILGGTTQKTQSSINVIFFIVFRPYIKILATLSVHHLLGDFNTRYIRKRWTWREIHHKECHMLMFSYIRNSLPGRSRRSLITILLLQCITRDWMRLKIERRVRKPWLWAVSCNDSTCVIHGEEHLDHAIW